MKAREWGRKLAIVWAWFSIIVTSITTWMTAVHVHPTLTQQMTQRLASQPNSEAVVPGMKMGMTIAVVMTTVLWIAHGIVIIAALSRAKVKVFCQTQQQGHAAS